MSDMNVVRTYVCSTCGTRWPEQKPHHARYDVLCPYCTTDGRETYTDLDTGIKMHKIEIDFRSIQHIKPIDHQDGNTGEAIDFSHALGPSARNITGRQQLEAAKKRAREQLFLATDGPHTVPKPFVGADGKLVYEKVTSTSKGFDMGEVHEVENLPEIPNVPKSAFEPGKTLDQTEAKLKERLGEDAE